MKNCSLKDRTIMLFLDCIFSFVVATAFLILLYLIGEFVIWVVGENIRPPIAEFGFYSTRVMFFLLMLFKDVFFKEKGFSERIMKIKIINISNENRPSKKQLLIRNIFYPIAVIDFIVCHRRLDHRTLGDIVSKTRVVYDKETEDDSY